MKKILSISAFALIVSSCGSQTQSTLTAAKSAPKKCAQLAASETKKKFGSYFYANGRKTRDIVSTTCELNTSAAGNKYVKCEVGAIGDDVGSVDFSALLNADCSRAFKIFITGEE